MTNAANKSIAECCLRNTVEIDISTAHKKNITFQKIVLNFSVCIDKDE